MKNPSLVAVSAATKPASAPPIPPGVGVTEAVATPTVKTIKICSGDNVAPRACALEYNAPAYERMTNKDTM